MTEPKQKKLSITQERTVRLGPVRDLLTKLSATDLRYLRRFISDRIKSVQSAAETVNMKLCEEKFPVGTAVTFNQMCLDPETGRKTLVPVIATVIKQKYYSHSWLRVWIKNLSDGRERNIEISKLKTYADITAAERAKAAKHHIDQI